MSSPSGNFKDYSPQHCFIIRGTIVYIIERWCRKLHTLTYQSMDLLIRFCSHFFPVESKIVFVKRKSWQIVFVALVDFCERIKLLGSYFKNIYGKCHWFIRADMTNLCTSHFQSSRPLDERHWEPNHFKAYFRCLFSVDQHRFSCVEASGNHP